MGYVEISKQTKKAQKEYYSQQRVGVSFNTGTRDMKSEKDYDRANIKRETKRMYDDGEER